MIIFSLLFSLLLLSLSPFISLCVIQSLAVWTNTLPESPAGQTIDGKYPWLNQITSARFVAEKKERE